MRESQQNFLIQFPSEGRNRRAGKGGLGGWKLSLRRASARQDKAGAGEIDGGGGGRWWPAESRLHALLRLGCSGIK